MIIFHRKHWFKRKAYPEYEQASQDGDSGLKILDKDVSPSSGWVPIYWIPISMQVMIQTDFVQVILLTECQGGGGLSFIWKSEIEGQVSGKSHQ